MCVHLDGLNAEHKFQVLDTINSDVFDVKILKNSTKEKTKGSS